MRTPLLLTLVCLVISAVPTVSQTPPVISGVTGRAAHEAALTVSGSSFGNKPTAAPLKYDDFQNLAIGDDLSVNGWRTSGYRRPRASNEFLRPGTPYTRNAHAFFEANIPFSQSGDVSNFSLTGLTATRYYLDAWHYITTRAGTVMPSNIKPWRLHQVNAGAPNAYFGFAGPAAGDTGFGRDGTAITDSGYFGSNDNGVRIPLSGADWYNHWLHLQVLLDVGTPGSTNGTMVAYINGRLRMNYRGNIRVLAAGFSNFPELYLGNYVRSDPHGDTHAYWESVYVDSSWCRAEIGNNPVYALATRREIQRITSWTPTSVGLVFNRGDFQPGEQAWLYVGCDPTEMSAGFAITIGGTAPPPPPPPTLSLTCPAPISVQLATGTAAPVSFSATTSGGVSPIIVLATPESGSPFSVGATTVSVRAHDSATPLAQEQSCSFTVTVLAPIPPAPVPGCLDGTRRYAVDDGPEIERPADGTREQRATIAARVRALRKAGFLVDVTAKSTYTQLVITCSTPTP